ncbi:helix-turn-helix domain-containing protein [Streptomyces sp. NPDC005070]
MLVRLLHERGVLPRDLHGRVGELRRSATSRATFTSDRASADHPAVPRRTSSRARSTTRQPPCSALPLLASCALGQPLTSTHHRTCGTLFGMSREQRRRRRPSSACPDEELGTLIRRLRRDARQLQVDLAAAAGISASQLSRLERGRRTGVSIDVLIALDTELSAEGRVLAAAHVVPPPAASLLSPLHFALNGRRLVDRTARAVAAVHHSAFGEQLWERAGSARHDRVQLAPLCRAAGLQVDVADGRSLAVELAEGRALITIPVQPASPQRLPLERFLTAHALAHILYRHASCTYPRTNTKEEAATATACYLLAPSELLHRATEDLRNRYHGDGMWSVGGASALAEAIASRLGAPGWLTVRRLAEEGYLETIAEENCDYSD